jgi:glucokinase
MNSHAPVEYLLAVDLGGTKVAAALMDMDGKILLRKEEPTCQLGPKPGIDQITGLLEDLLTTGKVATSQVRGVGVGIPAVLEEDSDRVIWAPNLADWHDVALRPTLEARLELPVMVEYDGHTAALGEWWQGAGRGYRSLAMVIVGTGIGGGLILDGKLFRGHNRLAGAAGWFALTGNADQVDPYGQSIGHWESLAAGPGIVRRAQVLLKDHPDSSLNQFEPLTARQVFEAAHRNDPLARQIIAQTASLLGLGVANIISLVNPEIVILGGSIGRQEDLLLPRLRQVVLRWAQPASAHSASIVASQLGTDAGLYGAAYAVLARSNSLER